MDDAEAFWRMVKTAAAFRGKTMRQVARDIGVSSQYLSRSETRGKFISTSRLVGLSKSLGISIEVLMTPEALDQIEDVFSDTPPRMTPRQLYMREDPAARAKAAD